MEENEKYEPAVSGNGGEAPVSELEALKEERDGLYDRLLRKQAEFENYKKRIDRERSEFVQFASAELMRELLNALDSFDLALRNTGGDLRGFELIYKQLQDTMGRFGLKPIEAKGQKFDPNFHQAVATQPADDVEENTVVDEMRKGYTLNGRLLRPAMVTVSIKKES
jgi:molecular chaperone GrpE